MALALVGSVGAISTGSAPSSITPAFGQATSAGNLLIARVVMRDSNSLHWPLTTSPGWVLGTDNTSGNFLSGTGIFYKPNCAAGETAPTFTITGGGTASEGAYADLFEISGADAISPLDRIAADVTPGGGAASNFANSTGDTNTSDLAVLVSFWAGTKSTTLTVSEAWTPGGGTVVANHGTQATKGLNWVWFSAYLLNGNGGVADNDAVTGTVGTGILNTPSYNVASFKPSVVTVDASLIYDDRRIRRNVLLRL